MTNFKTEAKSTYRKFSLNKLETGIEVVGTGIILLGNDIAVFLENSSEIILMAATLGFEADRLIEYTQKVSLADAVVLDNAANQAIEEVCDDLQAELAGKYNITRGRFSCGYGDLPLNIQPEILNALGARKTIGLYCNENNLMLPQKSVTAILGVLDG